MFSLTGHIKLANIKYQEDEQLIFTVHVQKYNKDIFIKWNNKYLHSIIERIKSRTSFKYTSEFNNVIKNGIIILFEEYLDELDQDGRITKKKYQYFEDMMNNIFSDDPELPIIKEKIDNLMSLLNSKTQNNDELEAFLDLDFETEIWKMI